MSAVLKFAAYRDLVAANLRELGFRPVASGPADIELELGYGVGDPEQHTLTRPGRYRLALGYDAIFHDVLYRRHYRFRAWPRYYHDPPRTVSYTVFRHSLSVRMRESRDENNETPVFEARAESVGPSSSLARATPRMVGSVFAGFPGRNGETVVVDPPLGEKQAEAAGARATGDARRDGRANAVTTASGASPVVSESPDVQTVPR